MFVLQDSSASGHRHTTWRPQVVLLLKVVNPLQDVGFDWVVWGGLKKLLVVVITLGQFCDCLDKSYL